MAQLLPGVTVTSAWVLALLLITAVLQHSEKDSELGTWSCNGRIFTAVLRTWGGVHWIIHNALKQIFLRADTLIFLGHSESSNPELESLF